MGITKDLCERICATGYDDLPRFCLRRHAIGRVHGRTEYVVLFLHDGTVMAANTY